MSATAPLLPGHREQNAGDGHRRTPLAPSAHQPASGRRGHRHVSLPRSKRSRTCEASAPRPRPPGPPRTARERPGRRGVRCLDPALHSCTRDQLPGQRRSHHVDESVLQRAVKTAVRRAGAAEARKPSHPAPLVRDAPARGRPRHPNRPGTAGAPGRDHHHDLHPRLEWSSRLVPEHRRPDVRPHDPRPRPRELYESGYAAPRRSLSRTQAGRPLRPQTVNSKRRCAPSAHRLQIAIRCKKPRPLWYFTTGLSNGRILVGRLRREDNGYRG